MSPTNSELAAALDEYAALLELADASTYSTRAYRRAADLIRTTPASVADLVRDGRVRTLRGIGSGIEARLRELVETGRLAELEELRETVSPELAAFGRMHGFAAKRFVDIGAALGVRTVAELRSAAVRRAAARRPRGRCRDRGANPGGARLAGGGAPPRADAERRPGTLGTDRRRARRGGRRRSAPVARDSDAARRRGGLRRARGGTARDLRRCRRSSRCSARTSA